MAQALDYKSAYDKILIQANVGYLGTEKRGR